MARTSRVTDQRGSVVLHLSNANGQGGVRTLTLPITPEDIQISRPSRQAVTQTLTSAYQDHLGSGIATVTVRGHTGWRDLGIFDRTDLGAGTGYEVIKNLRDLLGDYDNRVASGNPSAITLLLMLNLPNGWELFRVSKNIASFSRSRAQPLLYRYEIQFTVLEDLNSATKQTDPSPNFVITLKNAPTVKLLTNPDTSHGDQTGGGGGNGVITSDPEVTKKILRIQAGKLRHSGEDDGPVESPNGPTLTDGGSPKSLGDYLGSIDPTGMTLADFAKAQYPSPPYPDNMYLYIVAANPDVFTGTGVAFGLTDPNQIIARGNTTYHIPIIDPHDAVVDRTAQLDEIRAVVKSTPNPARNVGGAFTTAFSDVTLGVVIPRSADRFSRLNREDAPGPTPPEPESGFVLVQDRDNWVEW